MNQFKKLINGNILLDGIVWSRSNDRSLRVKRNDTGNVLLNIRYENEFYYPIAIDRSSKRDMFSLVPKEETAW